METFASILRLFLRFFLIFQKTYQHKITKTYIMIFIQIFICLFGFLESNFLSSLYILDISHLLDLGLVNIFSQSVGCLFVLWTVSFVLQKFAI
uniref:Uncharacterized protein n=1 Tax=Mus spicilegus TaxID=10103 RepID=A0A8C6HPL6_MUSSI